MILGFHLEAMHSRSRMTFAALAALLAITLTGCRNRLHANIAPEFAGKQVAIGSLGITGEGTAAAIPAFQQAGYSVVDLSVTATPPGAGTKPTVPYIAFVDKVGTDGAWWDGFFDYSMRVTETSSSRIIWSSIAEYGQAGIFINQTASTDEAMKAMVADFAKSFPPAKEKPKETAKEQEKATTADTRPSS